MTLTVLPDRYLTSLDDGLRIAAPGMVGVVKRLASEQGRHRGADGAQLPDVCTQCGDEWCGGGWECEG